MNCDLRWTAVTVGTGTTAVLGINNNRKLLILHNISDTAMDCNVFGGSAVANEGIRIPAGGAWTFDAIVPGGAIACLNASGSKTLRVGEGT